MFQGNVFVENAMLFKSKSFLLILEADQVKTALYPAREDQVIFVSFFFRPAALQMLAVASATPALCALQVIKINSPKFHLPSPRGVWYYENQMRNETVQPPCPIADLFSPAFFDDRSAWATNAHQYCQF